MRQDQIKAYIKMRDHRADKLNEIPKPSVPRPHFRHREPPEREEHHRDQDNDQPNYDWMQGDSSDSANTVQAADLDADSSDWSSGSDLDWGLDELALFDFGIDDLGNDSDDDNYVDGIDDFDNGMDNPDYSGDYSRDYLGDFSVDQGSSGGDCDCLVYNGYPPPYSDSSQQDSSQDGGRNDNDRTDDRYDITLGVEAGFVSGIAAADIVEDYSGGDDYPDGDDYPPDDGVYDDTGDAYTPDDSAYDFDIGDSIDPGYSVDDSSWMDNFDSSLGGLDYTDYGGNSFDNGAWFDNGGDSWGYDGGGGWGDSW